MAPGTWPDWRRQGNERKDRHNTDRIRWTGLSSTMFIIHNWTRRRTYCIQLNKEAGSAILGSSLCRDAVFRLYNGGEGESYGGYFLHILSTSVHESEEGFAIPLSFNLRGRWLASPFPHGYDAMVFDWLWPSQQHTFNQDFIHPEIPPHPTISVALIK